MQNEWVVSLPYLYVKYSIGSFNFELNGSQTSYTLYLSRLFMLEFTDHCGSPPLWPVYRSAERHSSQTYRLHRRDATPQHAGRNIDNSLPARSQSRPVATSDIQDVFIHQHLDYSAVDVGHSQDQGKVVASWSSPFPFQSFGLCWYWTDSDRVQQKTKIWGRLDSHSALWSHGSFVQCTWSYGSLVLRPIGPTAHWSYVR